MKRKESGLDDRTFICSQRRRERGGKGSICHMLPGSVNEPASLREPERWTPPRGIEFADRDCRRQRGHMRSGERVRIRTPGGGTGGGVNSALEGPAGMCWLCRRTMDVWQTLGAIFAALIDCKSNLTQPWQRCNYCSSTHATCRPANTCIWNRDGEKNMTRSVLKNKKKIVK